MHTAYRSSLQNFPLFPIPLFLYNILCLFILLFLKIYYLINYVHYIKK